jgi:UDP-N-acetyl-2-amino-2-deoxyglucuronate dehydrogenase
LKTFALIGAAGYVAPRHMKAIKETGNQLVAALDPHDSVGILDSYFPNCHFFTEFERFDRHLEKLKRKGQKVDYISICSPNYLHDAHIRYGLRYGADVICEKPMVLNSWNVDAIKEIEAESDNKINNILQLRLHPNIIALKNKIDKGDTNKIYDVDLTYITSRGNWYHNSWKGDASKSGGIATNIGIHFFDMLIWIFGDVKENIIHYHEKEKSSGHLKLEKANVNWLLSIDSRMLPDTAKNNNLTTFRTLTIGNETIEFSKGFTDLHIKSYEEILAGRGFGVEENRKVVEVVSNLRRIDY